MAKTIPGWRHTEPSEDYKGSDFMQAISEAVRSHDGWVCPHCGYKEDLYNREMPTVSFNALVYEEETQKECCCKCGKNYYLKAHMTMKFYTCEDEEFED